MKIIEKLNNEDYHNDREYLSSSILKAYAISYRKGKAYEEKEHTQTPAMLLGSEWHSLMEGKKLVNFEAPVNPSTGKEYGATSAIYLNAKEKVKQNLKENEILTDNNQILSQMYLNLISDYEWINKGKIKNEVSYFDNNCEVFPFKTKCRADRIIENGENIAIIDFKTTSLVDLNPRTIKREFYKWHIDIQLYIYHKLIKHMYGEDANVDFIFMFTQTVEPFESLAVRAWDLYEIGEENFNKAVINLNKKDGHLYENFENNYGIINL